MLEIPAELDPALIPLAFLIGRWEGEGLAEYPSMTPVPYRERLLVDVVPDKPVLRMVSQTWSVQTGASVAWESGFWRPGENVTDVELLVAHASGFVEVLYGTVRGLSVELGTDAILATPTGLAPGAGTRTYGRVGPDLAYAFFVATDVTPMTGHAGARLVPAKEDW
jgi:hypothetical protein